MPNLKQYLTRRKKTDKHIKGSYTGKTYPSGSKFSDYPKGSDAYYELMEVQNPERLKKEVSENEANLKKAGLMK